MKTRWITLGEVRGAHYLAVVCAGFPGGFWVNWRGRQHPFLCNEFTTLDSVEAYAAWRLRKARLRLVRLRYENHPAPGWRTLRVQVARYHL